jgi:hypothetical protein
MTHHINDANLVAMYNGGASLAHMLAETNAVSQTIYRHLRANGIEPNRKVSRGWTPEEDEQLIVARDDGVTGQELCARVPTRSFAAIKGRLNKLRRTSGGQLR